MTAKNKSIYFCMLDNVNLEENVILDEFEIRYLNTNELKKILRFSENTNLSVADQEQLRTYEQLPWASVEKEISQKDAEDSTRKILFSYNLRFAHAGIMNWWPFTELIRTLNLARPSLGPIMCRHFYHVPFANCENPKDIEKIIYAEPTTDGIYDDERGTVIQPMLSGYTINQELVSDFMKMKIVLSNCLSEDKVKDNSYIRTAIHHFENGDRNMVPCPLEGSFNAIEPLMSYEAALESLIIREEENGENILALRISSLFSDNTKEVENFIRRVFWLRSKVAHGARPIEEIERLILHNPNDEIIDTKRKKRIPMGKYDSLILDGSIFPGFLVNLREITRFVIWFFCQMYESGFSKEETINKLTK